MSFKDIKLPDGFHIQKTGGRPRKDAKFIAIALCRMWRIDHLQEKAEEADRLILDFWGAHGVTDEAHIRAIVRRMTKELISPLRGRITCCLEDNVTGETTIMAVSRYSNKGWVWYYGLMEALPVESEVSVTHIEGTPFSHFSVTAQGSAVLEFFDPKNKKTSAK